MECRTLEYYDVNHQPVYKLKARFNTLEEAIRVAKIENAKPEHIHKVVAYKCNECYGFHVGRNGKEIKNKDRNKLIKEKTDKENLKELKFKHAVENMKVVGFIDLTKIRY